MNDLSIMPKNKDDEEEGGDFFSMGGLLSDFWLKLFTISNWILKL